MIHKICDECGKMESVDFMVTVDDNIYCIKCEPVRVYKRNPNYWVLKHINESEHEVLHLVYTKTDVEENSGRKTPRKFTDKEWDDIVGTFNDVEFDYVWDTIEECVEECVPKPLNHKRKSDDNKDS